MTMIQRQELISQVLIPGAAAVSQMLGFPLQVVRSSGTGPTRETEGILISLMFSGDFAGELVVQLSPQAGLRLASRLLGSEQELPLNRRAVSALLELGNILASAFVNELDNQLALACRPHPPRLIADFPPGGPAPLQFQLRGSREDADLRMQVCLFAENGEFTFQKS